LNLILVIIMEEEEEEGKREEWRLRLYDIFGSSLRRVFFFFFCNRFFTFGRIFFLLNWTLKERESERVKERYMKNLMFNVILKKCQCQCHAMYAEPKPKRENDR
jgi:hypothetical protein